MSARAPAPTSTPGQPLPQKALAQKLLRDIVLVRSLMTCGSMKYAWTITISNAIESHKYTQTHMALLHSTCTVDLEEGPGLRNWEQFWARIAHHVKPHGCKFHMLLFNNLACVQRSRQNESLKRQISLPVQICSSLWAQAKAPTPRN